MRETEAGGRIVRNSSSTRTHVRRLNVASGIALAMVAFAVTAGTARAADDEEKSGTGKILDEIKATIVGTSIDDGKIEYRERSPLVVPPRLDLPPPAAASATAQAPNWPKDPSEGRRKPSKKKSKPGIVDLVLNPFKPSNEVETIAEEPASPATPRPEGDLARVDPVYDKAGDLLSGGIGALNLFGSKPQSATFTGEPTRESLTQPPAGYQTPSPSFPYGIGKDGLEVPKPHDESPILQRTEPTRQ